MNDILYEKRGLIIEYWNADNTLYGVIEVEPRYRKDGCLVLYHSEILRLAMLNHHADGTLVYKAVIKWSGR